MKRILLPIIGFIGLGLLVLFAKKQTAANPDAGGDEDQSADYPDMLPLHTKFPDFHVASIDRKPLSVAGDKGKVILIDFWATWCGPCVAELPNVVEVYKKYHKDGFDIIGVSLDGPSYKKDLAAFLPQHEMTWPQYCDGNAWDNDLAVKYNVHAIPCTYLLDGNGNIIAENLRGSALAGAVAKALLQAANPPPDAPAPTNAPGKTDPLLQAASSSSSDAPASTNAPAKTDASASPAASGNSNPTPADTRRLRDNLTRADIVTALGTPDSAAKLGAREILNYKSGVHVELTNGAVTSFTGTIPDALK